MLPLTVTLLLALAAALAAYGLLWLLDRRATGRRGIDPVPDEAPPASRLMAVLPALLGLAAMSLVIGLLAESVEGQSPVVHWDERVERWATDEAGDVATNILRLITHLGDTVTIITVTVVTVVALLAYGHRRLALFLATAVVGQWAISTLVKELVARARPDLDPLAAFSGFSFPSGHSTAAAATYLGLALVASALRPRWSRPLLAACAVAVGVAVAASRVLLGVHWFSDVVGGLLVGWT